MVLLKTIIFFIYFKLQELYGLLKRPLKYVAIALMVLGTHLVSTAFGWLGLHVWVSVWPESASWYLGQFSDVPLKMVTMSLVLGSYIVTVLLLGSGLTIMIKKNWPKVTGCITENWNRASVRANYKKGS